MYFGQPKFLFTATGIHAQKGNNSKQGKLIKRLLYLFQRCSKGPTRGLLKEVTGGNKAAFQSLVNSHYDHLYAFAVRHVKSDKTAKALVKETFQQVWVSRHLIDPQAPAKNQLGELITQQVFDYLHRAARAHALRDEIWHQTQLARGQAEYQSFDAESQQVTDRALPNQFLQKQLVHKLSIP